MNQLAYIPAGMLAAVTSWLINGLFFRRLGTPVVVYVAPGVEEAAKTGFALLLGASIPLAHLIFGLVEGVWDAIKGGRGLVAGLVGLASHVAFGVTTGWLYHFTGNPWPAVAGAYLLHTGWNRLVIALAVRP